MSEVYLERPDLFKPSLLQPLAGQRAKFLLKIGQLAEQESDYQPSIAVLVRTKDDIRGLEGFIKHIEHERKNYRGRIDIVVVDTESNDGTRELAKRAGATLVNIKQSDFTYPKSLNLGLEVVKDDVVAVVVTVGHAGLALSNALKGAVRHFSDKDVAGVWSKPITNSNASPTEKFFSIKADLPRLLMPYKVGVHEQKQITMGTMGATNCVVRMSVWREHKFDDSYARGGEDTAWARKVINKYKIIYDPIITVHHSHGLNFINAYKQYKHWHEVYSGPGKFSRKDILSRRPDME
jgi:glycosyltransferase involved in cell wall biosynthesis